MDVKPSVCRRQPLAREPSAGVETRHLHEQGFPFQRGRERPRIPGWPVPSSPLSEAHAAGIERAFQRERPFVAWASGMSRNPASAVSDRLASDPTRHPAHDVSNGGRRPPDGLSAAGFPALAARDCLGKSRHRTQIFAPNSYLFTHRHLVATHMRRPGNSRTTLLFVHRRLDHRCGKMCLSSTR